MAKRTELEALLEGKSREDLVVMLKALVEWHPELLDRIELLVKLPLARPKSPGRSTNPAAKKLTLDETTIRRQVIASFRKAGHDWRAALQVADELRELSQVAHKFGEAGQWENARVIYTAIAEEAAAHYNEINDESEVFAVIDECVNGLVTYLDNNFRFFAPLDPAFNSLLKTFYELWKFGESYGSFEEKLDEIIIAYLTTTQERAMVEEWLRADIVLVKAYASKWRNQRQLNFLAALKQSSDTGFGEEELLEEYRQAGMYRELADKLLELNRLEEALHVVREQLDEPREVTNFADKLLDVGAEKALRALELVGTKLAALEKAPLDKKKKWDYERDTNIDNYRAWLNEKLLKYGRPEQALAIALQRFEANPSVSTYTRVKEAAQSTGKWPELRNQLLDILVRYNRQEEMVTIYLQEKEIEKAADLLLNPTRTENKPNWQSAYNHSLALSGLYLETARAAEESYPLKAIALYRLAAEYLVEVRGRDNYQDAAKYLARVRELYLAQQGENDWQEFIADFRKNHKSLAALKQELDKKGLE